MFQLVLTHNKSRLLFSSAEMFKKPLSMANSVDPEQTAPLRAVCSGSMLFASIPNSSILAADDFSRQHFQVHFFLGALRVKAGYRVLINSKFGLFYSNFFYSDSNFFKSADRKVW